MDNIDKRLLEGIPIDVLRGISPGYLPIRLINIAQPFELTPVKRFGDIPEFIVSQRKLKGWLEILERDNEKEIGEDADYATISNYFCSKIEQRLWLKIAEAMIVETPETRFLKESRLTDGDLADNPLS